MLGEFVDEFTVKVVDVFAMPQSGTGVSVEAVDPVFQTKMLDMLKQTGRWACAVRGPLVQGNCADGSMDECSGAMRDFQRDCVTERSAGQRWWWAGITATRASAAGCRAWTSTRSRALRRSTSVRCLSLLIPSSPSRARYISTSYKEHLPP